MKKIPIQIIWITKFIIIDTLSKLISLRFIKIIPTVIGIRKRTNPLKIEVEIINENSDKTKSSPDSCVKCYTMFLPFLLIKIDVFS